MDIKALSKIVTTPGQGEKTLQLLKSLGVPKNILYSRQNRKRVNSSFWLRPVCHLEILESAKRLWRQQIIKAHPDRPGGNLELAILLNRAWDLIEKRFKEHGFELGK